MKAELSKIKWFQFKYKVYLLILLVGVMLY